MLDKDQQKLLQNLLGQLNPQQKIWLAGFMQGLTGALPNLSSTHLVSANKPNVDIYYATETGNSKALSLSLMKAVKAAGFKVKNASVNRIKLSDIDKKAIAIFLISTHGEGDPPESAHAFFEIMSAAPSGSFEGLSYAILGLGDKSYQIFCGAALNLDKELQRLGGKSFQENALFDVDFAEYTPQWIEKTVSTLTKSSGDQGITAPTGMLDFTSEPELRTGKGYSRLDPVKGIIHQIINLNDIDSKKQTYHIEITYEENITYTCGDAAGIILPFKDIQGKDPTPRLYSISSSPSLHAGCVHLTVALATHKNENGSIGYGLCSKYLADLKEGDEINFYIQQNQLFKLASDDTDIIMIGPGTGVAPFRSFVYERAERSASGRNWLFFGDQHAHCDFLYQAEWQEHLATGALNRIDLAFSRDQENKIYVQHRLKEKGKDIVDWLEGGATLYICGTKDPMSRDVEQMLIEIISDQKSITVEAAKDYLANLSEQDRYLKDVY